MVGFFMALFYSYLEKLGNTFSTEQGREFYP